MSDMCFNSSLNEYVSVEFTRKVYVCVHVYVCEIIVACVQMRIG